MRRNHAYYTGYTEEQFAADEYFQQWVLNPGNDNNAFWNSYININPEQQDAVSNARRLVEELAASDYSMSPLTGEEKQALRTNIFQQLNLTEYEESSLHKRSTNKWWLLGAAAILLVMIAVAGYFLSVTDKSNYQLLIVRTGAGEMKKILLSDSSLVTLNANSSLQYSNHFLEDTSREVYLEGNAFFKVKKDIQHKAFIVHVNALQVKVLGTEFNVNARSKATEIVLVGGRVSVTDKKETANMLPGDKVQFDTLQQRLVSSKTDTQLYSAWMDGKWNFHQTSLEEIAGLLATYYGVDVVFKNEKKKRLKMSAVIPVTSLQQLVPVIVKTLGVKVTQENNQLVIQ